MIFLDLNQELRPIVLLFQMILLQLKYMQQPNLLMQKLVEREQKVWKLERIK